MSVECDVDGCDSVAVARVTPADEQRNALRCPSCVREDLDQYLIEHYDPTNDHADPDA